MQKLESLNGRITKLTPEEVQKRELEDEFVMLWTRVKRVDSWMGTELGSDVVQITVEGLNPAEIPVATKSEAQNNLEGLGEGEEIQILARVGLMQENEDAPLKVSYTPHAILSASGDVLWGEPMRDPKLLVVDHRIQAGER